MNCGIMQLHLQQMATDFLTPVVRNRFLFNAVQLIRNLMRQWIRQTLQVKGTAPEAQRQHKDIFQKITSHDQEGARAAMHSHLDTMGKLLLTVRSIDEE